MSALFGVVSMSALALSIVAIVVAGGRDDERPAPGGTGAVQTVAVEFGDLQVRPDRVEVSAGTQLIAEVTNTAIMSTTSTWTARSAPIGRNRASPRRLTFGVIDAEAQAWCAVRGHNEAGMVLTITLTPAAPGAT